MNILGNYAPSNQRFELIWVQAKVNFLKRYYGSFAGVLWAFINPMVQFMVYYVVFSMIRTNPDENRAVALMLGLILWSFLSEGAQQGINLLFQKRFIIENLQYNRIDMYISSVLSVIFSFVINSCIYILFAIIFGVTLSSTILLFPILFLNLLLFVIALQLILSVTFPVVRDVTHLWDKLKLGLFWMSGVIFPMSLVKSPMREILLWCNPFSGIIMNIKNICVYNKPIEWTFFFWDFFLAGCFLLIAAYVNKRLYFSAVEKL